MLFYCGSSVIGASHVSKYLPNQDAYCCMVKRKFFFFEKYRLFVVSDGLGSKPHSDFGSKMVCKAVEIEVANFFKNARASFSVTEFLNSIVDTWKKLVAPYEPTECAATCQFVLVTQKKILVARLGDGMVCVLKDDPNECILLTDNKESNFTNQTYSMADMDAFREFSCNFYDRGSAYGLVITTDGISADLKNGMELPFAADIFVETEKTRFWKREKFLADTMANWSVSRHSDDKTIVVASL